MESDKFYNKVFTPDMLLESRLSQFPDDEDLRLLEEKLENREKVLDIGSGIGYASEYLRKRGKSVTAIEPSTLYHEYAVSKAKNSTSKNPEKRVDYINKRIQDYEFDKRFDAVIFMWSVFNELNLKDQTEILNKSISALNENGIVFIDTLNFRVQEEEYRIEDESIDRTIIVEPDYKIIIKRPEGSHIVQCDSPLNYHLKLNKIGFEKIIFNYYDTATTVPRMTITGYRP